MRILSLGFPMPGAAVDHYSFASAPSFFDYDALVVEPLALSALIEEIVAGTAEHATSAKEPVRNVPASPDSVALADLLRQRRDETERLLARGGLVVCFAQPNAPHDRVAGFAGCDRYCWLPAPAGLRYDEPFLHRGAGTQIGAIELEHPFGPFVHQFRAKLAYRAHVAEDAPDFTGRVFARSAGGAALGVELPLGAGRVVFLPPPARLPAGDERYAWSKALQEAVRRLLRSAAAVSPPPWLAGHDLPGLRERIAARDAAQAAAGAAAEALDSADGAVEELERYRRLLWQEGKFGLEEPVRAALALLGFLVLPDDLDTPAYLRLEGDRAVVFVEAEGSVDAVGMAAHYRLRQRLEDAVAQGKPARGLLFINGHRTQPPDERPPQHQDALRVAAETMRYGVCATSQLFAAVRAALAGDESTARAFREALLTTEGVLDDGWQRSPAAELGSSEHTPGTSEPLNREAATR